MAPHGHLGCSRSSLLNSPPLFCLRPVLGVFASRRSLARQLGRGVMGGPQADVRIRLDLSACPGGRSASHQWLHVDRSALRRVADLMDLIRLRVSPPAQSLVLYLGEPYCLPADESLAVLRDGDIITVQVAPSGPASGPELPLVVVPTPTPDPSPSTPDPSRPDEAPPTSPRVPKVRRRKRKRTRGPDLPADTTDPSPAESLAPHEPGLRSPSPPIVAADSWSASSSVLNCETFMLGTQTLCGPRGRSHPIPAVQTSSPRVITNVVVIH